MRVVTSLANNCLCGVFPPLNAKPGTDIGVHFIEQKGLGVGKSSVWYSVVACDYGTPGPV